MKEKYSMFRFVFASLACCLLAAALITGCGGGNNPSGPTGDVTTPTGSSDVATNTNTGTISGKIVAVGVGISVDEIPVVLEQNFNVIDETKSISTGEYYFEKIPQGIYVVRILASTTYNAAAAITNLTSTAVTAPDLQLVSTLSIGDTPTVNVKGMLIAALDGKGLSVAQLQLDTGYKTVTDVFGNFTLPNVASGQRQLDVTKPGMSDTSISFVVKSIDGTNVNTVSYNGADYAPVAGTADLTKIPLNYTLSNSTMITGTVVKFLKVGGVLTADKAAVPGFNFEIWMEPAGTNIPYTKIGTIVTENDGSYKLENLPLLPRTLVAVASGTIASTTFANDGTVAEYILVNKNAPWTTNPEFVFTSYYSVVDSKTTVMDITLPTFTDW